MRQKQIIYLPGLNGLRAIAALSVVVSHVSMQGISDFGLPYLASFPMAGYGVTLFFVISGFLITYLLINEIKETDTISISKFYVRRILRIWPIYYLFILIVILVFWKLNILNQILLPELGFYIFMMANIPFVTHSGIMILVHYWSIGVEEQFYLFWPWLVRFSKNKLLQIAIVVFIFLLSFKILFWILYGSQSYVYRFFSITRFHCMIIGAIFAVLFSENNHVLKYFTSRVAQIVSWFVFFGMGFSLFHIPAFIGQEIIAIASISMILSQVSNVKKVINLERNIFDFIGKISYGIYIIHPLIIFILSRILKDVQVYMPIKYFTVYTSVILLTILTSWISYNYYEKPVLKFKNKYTIVKSSNTMKVR